MSQLLDLNIFQLLVQALPPLKSLPWCVQEIIATIYWNL